MHTFFGITLIFRITFAYAVCHMCFKYHKQTAQTVTRQFDMHTVKYIRVVTRVTVKTLRPTHFRFCTVLSFTYFITVAVNKVASSSVLDHAQAHARIDTCSDTRVGQKL